MSYELLLLIGLFLAALGSSFARAIFQERPSPAPALRPEHRVLASRPLARSLAAAPKRIRLARVERHPDLLRIPLQALPGARRRAPPRVRAVPLNPANRPRSGVRLMVILAPPRAASRPARSVGKTDAAERAAAKPRGAGEGRRR
jgi:hypothetical protein